MFEQVLSSINLICYFKIGSTFSLIIFLLTQQLVQALAKLFIIFIGIFSSKFILQVWHVADIPTNDKFDYTFFAHKLNSFDTAPRNLLASDSRLRPDRFALEMGDLSKSGTEKSRLLTFTFIPFMLENMLLVCILKV